MMTIFLTLLFQPQLSGWELLSSVEIVMGYDNFIGAEVEQPKFSEQLKLREGKEVTLTGHYLPLELEGERIIISKLPYAACFFCGGGVGQESVAEVVFNNVQRPFKMDELITVTGKLELNVDDYEHLVFILKEWLFLF